MRIRLGGLTLQLLAIVILPFSFLLVAISLFSVRVHDQAMRSLVAERDQKAARAAAAALTEQLHHREAAVRNLGLRLAEGIPATSLLQSVSFLDADFGGGLAIADWDGTSLASSKPDLSWSTESLVDYISQVREQGFGFSPALEIDGEMLLIAGAAGDDRIVLGAFSISSMMQSATLSTGSSPGWSAFLVSETGQLLESVGESPRVDILADHPGVQAALRGEHGSSFVAEGERDEYVVAFSPVPPLGWALVIEEPWAEVSSPLLDVSLIAPLTLIPALVVALIALWFGARRVIEPLRELEEQAANIAAGDFEAIEEPLESIGEIQSLQAKIGWMASQIWQYQTALQRYIGAITAAQEDERGRLARELHDEIIQELIAIDQRVQLAMMKPHSMPPPDAESLAGIHESLQVAIQDLRRTIRGLRPIYLEDLGLVAALEMLARDTGAEIGHQVSFAVEGEIMRLDPGIELEIYRIAQEAITNAAKHASCSKLEVAISFRLDKFEMVIKDDGVGFEGPGNQGKLGASNHFGLLGMYERADLIGAMLEIRSTPGKGTSVEFILPRSTERS